MDVCDLPFSVCFQFLKSCEAGKVMSGLHVTSQLVVCHFMLVIQPHVEHISLKPVTVAGLIRHVIVIQLNLGRKVF